MEDERINLALDIVNQQITMLLKKELYSKDTNNQTINKIKILEEVKNKIYSGNVFWVEKIIQKSKE